MLLELSIFIDESGDFRAYESHAPFYLITLVLHNQSKDISIPIEHLQRKVFERGLPADHAIHTGPLIRREGEYKVLELPDRRKLFRHLFDFARIADIHYKTFVFEKRESLEHDALAGRMVRELSLFVRDNLEFFQAFDRIIVYYDNGQKEMVAIIKSIFNSLVNAEIRKVKPASYYLFQAADLFCTLELVRHKMENGGISKSEDTFFRGTRNLKKNYLKPIGRKSL
ncbi:DUF3800 domain-containing protein [Collinsella sp. AGMB00827]|uniref:DUF3800 domain-containing protein n=1 Tax=Collinsella ureilytica TaxID=2869515 RepID=A0ABS7MI17_9ACTN|nr:DUF3800 domain-containing protein [Collinsella urealyticum]MBY4796984.1 DUF3800 domain-containing protein [Collinsella urealyticum]